MARKRKDIRDRTVPWMHLMYCIAYKLVLVILPSAEKVASSRLFMTFNPYTASREHYLTSLRIGHFWSQMTNVSEYVEIIRRIEQSAYHNSVNHNMLFVDTVIHALILDFMAFAGQHLGYYHDQSTLRNEDFLRRFLLNDIEAQTEPTFCNDGIKETFLLIARLIKPIKDPIYPLS